MQSSNLASRLSPKQSEVLEALLATRAIETLEHLMTDPATPAGVKLRAATMVIQAVAQSDPYTKPAEPRLTTGDVDKIIDAGARVGAEESVLREAARQEPVEAPISADSPATTETKLSKPRATLPVPAAAVTSSNAAVARTHPGSSAKLGQLEFDTIRQNSTLL